MKKHITDRIKIFFSVITFVIISFAIIFNIEISTGFMFIIRHLMVDTLYSINIKYILLQIIKSVVIIIPVLIAVAYFTLFERKVMAAMQRRRGPNVVGSFGLLQPLADGLKLFIKEYILPNRINRALFIFAPISVFMLSLITWAIVPIDEQSILSDLNIGLLFLISISSLNVYSVLLAGWASNSKYALLGGFRATAQMISYEIVMTLMLVITALATGSLNLVDIVEHQQYQGWLWWILFPEFIIFYIAVLAETGRPPFDLPEAEGELVAGYHVEYSGMGFGLFFIAENVNIILMCCIMTTVFFGGWLPPDNFVLLTWIPGPIWFGLKVVLLLFSLVWVRASLPRYRFDQLMSIGWTGFLPLGLALFIIMGCLLFWL
jgi:NADH-quinone oxidoreductase subunit H